MACSEISSGIGSLIDPAQREIGVRLKEARLSRGFSESKVASLSAISTEVIASIEDGAVNEHLAEVYALICLYEESVYSIFKGVLSDEGKVQKAGSKTVGSKEHVAEVIEFHKKLRGQERGLKSIPFGRSRHNNFQRNDVSERKERKFSERTLVPQILKRRARDILQEHELYKLPINVYQIAENLNISVSFEAFPSELYMDVKGFCYKDDELSLIGINRSHPVALQRFTMAHELHHYIYDFNDVRFLCGPSNRSKSLEINAERFAAELLMPHEHITKLISNPANIRYLTISLVAEHFGVSYEAAAIRMANYGLLDDVKLYCQHSQRKKDKQKTDYLLTKYPNRLLAVFGLETGIKNLQLEHKPARHEVCGAAITNPSDSVCWRCGLELSSEPDDYLKNHHRQSHANTSPNKVFTFKTKEQDYKQLSINLSV